MLSISVVLGSCVDNSSMQIEENTTENLLTTTSTSETEKPEETPEASSETKDIDFGIDIDIDIMEVLIFDAGKADAILITTDAHTVIIDTGEQKHGAIFAEYLSSHDITEIDYLIITHFDKDHVGGADTIIENFTVKEVIVPNYGKESKQYEQFITSIDAAKIELCILTEILEFNINDMKFTLYPSQQEYYYFSSSDADGEEDDDENENDDENDNIPNENNFSIVTSVKHGNNNFLFTGDAKSKRLKELLSIGDIVNTKYNFLKVPHHGQYNKRSTEFIYMIKPEYAVITCSSKKPSDERVVAALEDAGAEIYSTVDGNVYCKSNGKELIVAYK